MGVMRWVEEWLPVLVVVLALGVVAAVIAAELGAFRERARCTDNGGSWRHANCRTVEDPVCITTDYGNGMVITTCIPTPSTVCDHVCRGARAEAR